MDLSRISAYQRANVLDAGGLRSGPFTVLFDAADPHLFLNYAVPDDGTEPSTSELEALVALFETRGRTPRLEYLPDLAPAVTTRLEAAGFRIEQHLPVLVYKSKPPAQPPVSDVEWRLVEGRADLETAARVQNEAFGGGEATAADVDRLMDFVRRGGAVALARSASSGEILGAGACLPFIHEVTEIVGVGVREPARGRGIGGGLAAFLARSALERGVAYPFLTTTREIENRTYARVGFAPVGVMAHVSR